MTERIETLFVVDEPVDPGHMYTTAIMSGCSGFRFVVCFNLLRDLQLGF
jgi:hypothetical protein